MLDQLVEDGFVKNYGEMDEPAYVTTEKSKSYRNGFKQEDPRIHSSGTPTPYNINTPFNRSNNDIAELEGFIDRHMKSIITPEDVDDVTPHAQLIQCQKDHIELQKETIFYLRNELENKQKNIDKLLETLSGCLHQNSTLHDENILLSRNSKINSTTTKSCESSSLNTNNNTNVNVVVKDKYNDNVTVRKDKNLMLANNKTNELRHSNNKQTTAEKNNETRHSNNKKTEEKHFNVKTL